MAVKTKQSLLALTVVSCCMAFAAPVSPERAFSAVGAWVSRGPAPSRTPTGEVRTFALGGTNAFHFVALASGEKVVVPCDDSRPPVLGIFDDDMPEPDSSNPVLEIAAGQAGVYVADGLPLQGGHSLVFTCEDRNVAKVRTRLTAGASAAGVLYDPECRKETTWADLESGATASSATKNLLAGTPQASAGNPQTIESDSLIEIRVPVLTKTKWSQGGVSSSKYCYNYYTPDHTYSGCTITAFAQIMRYHKYPVDEGLPAITRECEYGPSGSSYMTNFTTIAYERIDWDNMPEQPTKSTSDSKRREIGLLMYNLGVLSQAHYGMAGGTGCALERSCSALKNYYSYASADNGMVEGDIVKIRNSLLANLDAGYPCGVELPGHAVVGDGYGFYNGSLYCHLNMGWGEGGYWYLNPSSSSAAKDGSIIGVCPHIFPTNDWRLVTGRVLKSGSPLSGATVTATVRTSGGGSPQTLTATTNDKGIYSITVPNADCEVALTSSRSGYVTIGNTARTVAGSFCGSSWGNDILLVDASDWCIWTGAAGDCKFSTADNWQDMTPSDSSHPNILFSGCGAVSVTNDISELSPATIVFGGCTGAVTVRGNGIAMDGGGVIRNINEDEAAMPVMEAAVEFDGDIQIEGDIDFRGGVTGETADSVERFIGRYVLTTGDDWRPYGGIVTSGSSVTVGSFNPLGGVEIQSGGAITAATAKVAAGANLLYRNDGEFVVTDTMTVGSLSGDNDSETVRWTPGGQEDCTGSFIINRLVLLGGQTGDNMYFNAYNGSKGDATGYNTYVIGPGGIVSTNRSLSTVLGWKAVLRCGGDYAIATKDGAPFMGTAYGSGTLCIDTSDWRSRAVGHTVTVEGQIKNDGDSVVSVEVLGCGRVNLRNADSADVRFGALTVKDTATLDIGEGAQLGKGALTMHGGTTLVMPAADVALPGEFSLAADVSPENPVTVVIGDGGALQEGSYRVLTAKSLPDGDIGGLMSLVNPVQIECVPEFRKEGTEIWVDVRPVAQLGWINESAETTLLTGAWAEDMTYGPGGTALIDDGNEFTPSAPSTGNVVTVEFKVTFGESAATVEPGEEPQAALRLGTNGCFQVWVKNGEWGTGNGEWIDVAAAGVTPVPEREYTFRLTMHYAARKYCVALVEGGAEHALAAADDTTAFPLAAAGNAISKVAFKGDAEFTSMLGGGEWIGFTTNDVVCGTVRLTEAQADWLNALGLFADVSNRVAVLSAEGFDKAYLCNLDITKDGADADFEIVGFRVTGDGVEVDVSLVRTNAVKLGGVDAPINGVLRFYGAATPAALRGGGAQPLAATVSGGDFGDGETATAAIDAKENPGLSNKTLLIDARIKSP